MNWSYASGRAEDPGITKAALSCVVQRTFVIWATPVTNTKLQKGSLAMYGIVCVPVETQRIVSTHAKMIQMLVVIGWVRSRTQGRIVVQMSDHLSLAHLTANHCIAVIIHRLVETQPDVEIEIYFKFQNFYLKKYWRIGRIKYIYNKLFCTEP